VRVSLLGPPKDDIQGSHVTLPGADLELLVARLLSCQHETMGNAFHQAGRLSAATASSCAEMPLICPRSGPRISITRST